MGQAAVFTPQWLEENAKLYNENPELQSALKKLKVRMGYVAEADPALGVDEDFYWITFHNKGELTECRVSTREEIAESAEFLLVAEPARWVSLLKKESKFGTDFAMGKVKLGQGNKIGVLKVAPYAKHVVDLLLQNDPVIPG